jgi:hypothetical protein
VTRYRLTLLAFILAAFFLRVWQLPTLPPGLWYDEAYNAMDALWMAQTGDYHPFVVGNNGREAMLHILLSLSISVLGNTTFAVRIVGSLAGVLTIPIMYRFTLAMARPFVAEDERVHRTNLSLSYKYWFAVAAAGWVAVSWWHLLNSRAGFRPVLLPPLLMASLYFWGRGYKSSFEFQVLGFNFKVSNFDLSIKKSPFLNFFFAGLFLGLAQYTYLPARLAPLIFTGLTILWTISILLGKPSPSNHAPRTTHYASRIIRHASRSFVTCLLLGFFITTVTAILIFLPLGLFFLNNPTALSSRTQDVAFAPNSLAEIMTHMGQAAGLFLGAGHELYRHHLPGRAMLGWLEIPFFWLGLIMMLRPTILRRPETQLILLSFGVMWLPALLASPPVHALRPIGLLPFYYFIVTVGLYTASDLTLHVLRFTHHVSRPISQIFSVTLAVIITLNGLINAYDYFRPWANHPEVYKEFNGPLADLSQHLIELTATRDVIIPFHVYAHPVMRYFLHGNFIEVTGQPPATNRPTDMLVIPDLFQLLYVGNIPYSPALVLLTRTESGQGQIYVSRPPRADEQPAINAMLASAQNETKPFKDKLNREIAYFIPIINYPLSIINLFNPTRLRAANLTWSNLAHLQGYDVTPELAQPGRPITINFYWRSLTELTFDYKLFLQLVDSAGNPINQWEGDALLEDMYRWRWNGILPTQHTLWLGPETPPGPYLVRLGFFDRLTGERLPITSPPLGGIEGGQPDQIHLGLFYVSPAGRDPRLPATPLSANFADAIQLTGVTLPDIQNSQLSTLNSQLSTQFHWRALHPTHKPYTVFLQLLNQQGEIISSWDSQPFGGLYPTNLWPPGEDISDTFLLPLPGDGLPPGQYRLISGFYDFETGQRLSVVGGGDFAELGEFGVEGK